MNQDYLENAACRGYIRCLNNDDCYKNYSICVLRKRGYVDNENNINEAMYNLMMESNIGYVFASDNEREHFLNIVKNLTKIDAFVTNHCYKVNDEYQWLLPLHPNIYCPKGQVSGVTVKRFCLSCRTFCTSTPKSLFCRILKTGKGGYCGF